MKPFKLAYVFFVAFALFVVGVPLAYSQQKSTVIIPLPSVSGPSLGDPTSNLYTVIQGLQNNTYVNSFSYTTITVAAGQTTSTVLQYGMNFLTAAVGTTATMVMPTAKPGAELFIANNTGQGVALFGSNTPFVTGSQDFINNVAGNTVAATPPYGIGTSKTVVQCFVPQGGNWWCSAGN